MAKKQQPAFEEALTRLEEIVRRMETGKLSLDETAALYEEGLALTKLCRGKLEQVRAKVMKLTGEGDAMREVAFDTAEDDDLGGE